MAAAEFSRRLSHIAFELTVESIDVRVIEGGGDFFEWQFCTFQQRLDFFEPAADAYLPAQKRLLIRPDAPFSLGWRCFKTSCAMVVRDISRLLLICGTSWHWQTKCSRSGLRGVRLFFQFSNIEKKQKIFLSSLVFYREIEYNIHVLQR